MLYRQYIGTVQRNVKNDSKSFWKYVNGRRKQKGTPTNVRYHSTTAKTPTEAANMFARHFQSVYAQSNVNMNENTPSYNVQDATVISEDELKRKIDALDISKGAGPDGISNRILQSCCDSLLKPVFMLFNRSLHAKYLPMPWKCASVTPIWKSGSKLEVTNYRGVAILSAIPKLFEAIIYDRVYEQVAHRFHDSQHGFLRGKSVITNLAEFSSRVTKWMLDGYQVDVVYTDLTKAFDRISIPALICALIRAGVDGATCDWIRSYLSGRSQFVRFAGVSSDPFLVKSGVPQGSHLGPLLFVILMNDLPEMIQNSHVLIYADDVKLFKPVKTGNDCVDLQADVNTFVEFCSECNLTVNPSKCCSVTYTKKRDNISFEYKINNNIITKQSLIKDLGVTFDSGMTFNRHIELTISKVMSIYGMMKRYCADFNDPHAILAIYFGLARSVLEYASVVWTPFYAVHKNRLERVQKLFLRYAVRHSSWSEEPMSYEELCKRVGVNTLQDRRVMLEMAFLRDVWHTRFRSSYLRDQIRMNVPTRSLRHHRTFWTDIRRTNYGCNEIVHRMLTNFNSLNEVIDLDMTSHRIKQVLKIHFM